jgi:hypothetical protein
MTICQLPVDPGGFLHAIPFRRHSLPGSVISICTLDRKT